jgi:hypothetical protein
MKSVLYGLAALPFLAGVAAAGQPMQLSDNQMDKVTAGFAFNIIETSNTSWTQIRADADEGGGSLVSCGACYLTITNNALSVQAAFGSLPNVPT